MAGVVIDHYSPPLPKRGSSKGFMFRKDQQWRILHGSPASRCQQFQAMLLSNGLPQRHPVGLDQATELVKDISTSLHKGPGPGQGVGDFQQGFQLLVA